MDVIVVNYRTPYDLSEFLTSFQMYPPKQRHMLHIVNVLPDYIDRNLATDMFMERGAVSFHNIDQPMDYGRAVNMAGNFGSFDTIAMFNADTVLTEGLLDGCAELLWSEDRWGILGPRQVDEAGRLTSAGIFGDHARPRHRGWYEQDQGQYTGVEEAVMVPGSAFFMKRKLWDVLRKCPIYRTACPDALGPLLESHYYSDTWPCYHANAHDSEVIYDGSHTMVHKWHRSSPLGGYAENTMGEFRAQFRDLCDRHDLSHD